MLRFLESLPPRYSIGGVLLVSGFSEALENKFNDSDLDKINSFVIPSINLKNVKNIPKQAVVLHGSKDTTVPVLYAEKLSKGLGCKFVKVDGGGHFTDEEGCYELPEALEVLRELMK